MASVIAFPDFTDFLFAPAGRSQNALLLDHECHSNAKAEGCSNMCTYFTGSSEKVNSYVFAK